MEQALRELSSGYLTARIYGVLFAAVLLLVTRSLLPPGPERRVLFQPSFFLGAHVVALVVAIFIHEPSTSRLLELVALVALLASIGRAGGLLVFDILIGRKLGRPLPRIIRDIAQGVVYVFLLLAALRAVGFDPGSILTTGAIVTAVIGLSLQDTLGNLVAGLAIQIQRPFDLGDWIQFDDDSKRVGRVVEINWRATKVITLDEVEVTVPNGTLAKAPIVNFTKPERLSRRSVYVRTPFDAPPRRVQTVILEAILDAPGVLRDPAPSVVTNGFDDVGVEYWVRFYTDQFHLRDGVDGGVRDRVWYALQRAAIPIAVPQHRVHRREVTDVTRAEDHDRKVAARERALKRVDILDVVSQEQRRELASASETRLFAPGEIIVHQGDEDDELFMIERGEVAVLIEGDDPAAAASSPGSRRASSSARWPSSRASGGARPSAR
jgi:small-conductance mechanosensitive channel